MNEEIVSPSANKQTENRVIHFYPLEQCTYCQRFTSVAIISAGSFEPVCPLHGYSSQYHMTATPRELPDQRETIARFVLWMRGDVGRVVLISEVDPSTVPGYVAVPDPLHFEDSAWHVRYEAPDTTRQDLHVVWNIQTNQLLSPRSTPQYFCPNCQEPFWQGKQDRPDGKRENKQGA
jgi:hypothetical protein